MEETAIMIKDSFIELCSLLKLENMAASGGEAKQLISSGLVQVNGETEHRKRRKIVVGDMVECSGRSVRIASSSTPNAL
ncbi:RNA-binding S4 domain-containing protein [Desulfobulbus sp. F4]|nr:RNA-binding S4 domain-containing protein [Desulfobulbus sp. F3]MCW5200396.1 RNA-binding S4 domain-containing protein [Desulfobulbus sp. F4]